MRARATDRFPQNGTDGFDGFIYSEKVPFVHLGKRDFFGIYWRLSCQYFSAIIGVRTSRPPVCRFGGKGHAWQSALCRGDSDGAGDLLASIPASDAHWMEKKRRKL